MRPNHQPLGDDCAARKEPQTSTELQLTQTADGASVRIPPELTANSKPATTAPAAPQQWHATLAALAAAPTMPPVRDGFLQRRTRYGAWKERYFRIEGYQLKYYSDHLSAIKATKNAENEYTYDAQGSAAETIDLRGETSIEGHEELQFLLKHGSRHLEVKTSSPETRDAWVRTLRDLIEDHASRQTRVGQLSFECDGAYLIGDTGDACALEFQFRDQIFASAPVEVERRPELIYENLDEGFHDVAFCPLKLKASLSVYQTSNQFELRVVPSTPEAAERAKRTKASKPKRWFGTEDDTILIKSSEPLRAKHAQKAKRPNSKLYDAIVGDTKEEGEPLAVRHCTLFELRAESAAADVSAFLKPAQALRRATHYIRAPRRDAAAASALEGDVAFDPWWPARAPDGSAPRAGWRWYVLFDRVAEPDSMAEKEDVGPLRVRALLHCRLNYAEGLLQVAHALPRYEARDEHEEFTTSLLTNGMTRLGVAMDALRTYQKGFFDLVACRHLGKSLIAWVFLVGGILLPPEHAALTLFPFLLVALMLSGLPRVKYVGTQDYSLRDKGPSIKRPMADISVAVLQGRDLVAGDAAFSDAPSSDPYVVVVHKPPVNKRRLADVVIGVSAAKPKTLSPEWLGKGADRLQTSKADALDRPQTARALSADSHLDQILSLLAPGLHGEGTTTDLLADVSEANRSRDASKLSPAALAPYGNVKGPSIDFRAKWRPDAAPSEAAWNYPLLQEVESNGISDVRVPWRRAKGSVVIDVYDRDVASADDFLGRVAIPLRDVARAKGRSVEGWFPLVPSGDPTKDVALANHLKLRGSPKKKKRFFGKKAETFGALRLRVSLRVETTRAQTIRPWADWRSEQALCRSLLEPTAQGSADKKTYVGQYKSVTRTMKRTQDDILWMAGLLERFLALCSWQHPRKTLFACGGLLVAYVACCLVPNRLLVATVLSKMFLGGLCKRMRYGNKVRTGPKARDSTQVRAENFLASLPTAPQREVAARHKRLVRAQQHKRELGRVRVALNFAFRARCMGRCSFPVSQLGRALRGVVDVDGLEDEAQKRDWAPGFCAVVTGLLVVWPSLDAAAANRKPERVLEIAGPLTEAPADAPPPERGMASMSVCTRGALNPVVFAVKVEMVDAFVSAVRAEAAEAAVVAARG